MKRRIKITAVIIAVVLLFISCATTKTFYTDQRNSKGQVVLQESVYAEPYGIFNPDNKEPKAKYELSVGNAILSVLFAETIIVPVILCGWFLWNPVGKK